MRCDELAGELARALGGAALHRRADVRGSRVTRTYGLRAGAVGEDRWTDRSFRRGQTTVGSADVAGAVRAVPAFSGSEYMNEVVDMVVEVLVRTTVCASRCILVTLYLDKYKLY